MSTQSIQIVRGNAARAMRALGTMGVVISALLALALWLAVKDTTVTKVAVEFAFLIVMLVLVSCATVVAAFTVAKVQDERLDFFCCGIRMQSFALDGSTTFDLHKIGRLEMLRIQRGRQIYVPNGAFDRGALLLLLRTNGVPERPAD